MRRSAASICRHVVPPSSERYSPKLPIRYMRCALVFIATATDVRPVSRGRPPPVISCQVRPLSVDLKSLVCVGPVCAPPAPPPPPPPPPPPTARPAVGPAPRTTVGPTAV